MNRISVATLGINMPNPNKDELLALAANYGQGHLFAFWDELSEEQRRLLLEDIRAIDFPALARLIAAGPARGSSTGPPGAVEPVERLPDPWDAAAADDYRAAKRQGETLIAQGKVAAMTVAGGQGTRLGFDGPKGLLAISPVRNKSLFQLLAEGVAGAGRRDGCRIPWYVMTSPANDEATRTYFEENRYFGLLPDDLFFFQQGVMPALSRDGAILLDHKHRVALSPDGHGGSLTALAAGGALADMRRRGVQWVSYFQVDNPLVRPVDPLLVGLHDIHRSEASAVTVSKADDLERVGNLVRIGDRTHVIEYTELPLAMAHERTASGDRRFDAASLSIFLFSRVFLETLTSKESGLSLPWHQARKQVPYVDPDSGVRVEPLEPNAIKLERFIFDALPLARRTLVLRSRRLECFSPVKNATGVDSVMTARRDMSRRAAAWLKACGVNVPTNADGQPRHPCEISPLVAQDENELAEYLENAQSPPDDGPCYVG